MKPSALERAESLEQLRWLENGLSIRLAVTEGLTVSIDTPNDLAKADQFALNQTLKEG
jgi:3-deoxy-manno-octulosonate cytidylyltransferase (CMP-KDO synthetase)